MTTNLRHALVLAAAIVVAGSGMSAQKVGYKPLLNKKSPALVKQSRASETVPFQVVAEEHFSKFTAGSESEPDKTNIIG